MTPAWWPSSRDTVFSCIGDSHGSLGSSWMSSLPASLTQGKWVGVVGEEW